MKKKLLISFSIIILMCCVGCEDPYGDPDFDYSSPARTILYDVPRGFAHDMATNNGNN